MPSIQRIDVGTGRGLLPIKIAQKNKRLKAYGIDISKKAVDEARRNALASGLANAPQFGVGDVCALPFEDEFFDLVVSTFSLHHWPDTIAGLNEIAKGFWAAGGMVWSGAPALCLLQPDRGKGQEHLGRSQIEVSKEASGRARHNPSHEAAKSLRQVVNIRICRQFNAKGDRND